MPNIHFLVDLLFSPARGANIYTKIPSTVPSKEYIILGAHYDSEPGSPGAVDNAAGLALCIDIAARVSKLQVRHRNFMVVLFDQEEDNEVGSRAFVKKLRADNIQVHSVHVIDVIGWDSDQDQGIELQSAPPKLLEIYRRQAAKLAIPVELSQGGSSDNASFLNAGYPTAGIFSDELTPHLHKATDTYDTVDFGHLQSTSQLVWQVMHELLSDSSL